MTEVLQPGMVTCDEASGFQRLIESEKMKKCDIAGAGGSIQGLGSNYVERHERVIEFSNFGFRIQIYASGRSYPRCLFRTNEIIHTVLKKWRQKYW